MKRVREEEAGSQEAKPEAIKDSKRLRVGEEDEEERGEEEGEWSLLSGLPYVVLHQLLGYLSTSSSSTPASAGAPS